MTIFSILKIFFLWHINRLISCRQFWSVVPLLPSPSRLPRMTVSDTTVVSDRQKNHSRPRGPTWLNRETEIRNEGQGWDQCHSGRLTSMFTSFLALLTKRSKRRMLQYIFGSTYVYVKRLRFAIPAKYNSAIVWIIIFTHDVKNIKIYLYWFSQM